jgi:acyl-CoA synthetase (AMP-forming)/AMP-acid ligase II
MPPDNPATLGAAVRNGGPLRFISDETRRISLSGSAVIAGKSRSVAQFFGKTVMLALPKQLDFALALMALDGVARRLILWPPDADLTYLDAVRAAAGVDIVLTAWPSSEQCGMDGAAESLATEWVLLTSGTTGRPKLVVHTLASLAGHIAAAPPGQQNAGAGTGTIWCTFYDVRRYGGLQILLRAAIGGGSLVLSCADEAPGSFLGRAAAAGATHFLGTPSHWRRALMSQAAATIAPAYVRLSGEVADQGILDRLRAAWPQARIVHAFAATEAGLAFEVADGLAGFPASLVGAADGLAELEIRDDGLCVRSPRVARGYLDHGVAAIAGADGFVDTGDMVSRHGERYYFAGRRNGTVNVGGPKVHPEEVENVINQHPRVRMSLVRARANPITGAVVVAEVVVASDAAADAEEAALRDDIRAFCRARLPPHKVPVAIRIVPALDIAASGKLVRRVA